MFIEIRTNRKNSFSEDNKHSLLPFTSYLQMLINYYIDVHKFKIPKISKINIYLSDVLSVVQKPILNVCDVYIYTIEHELINLKYEEKFVWILSQICNSFHEICSNAGSSADLVPLILENVKQKIDSFEYTIHKLKYSPTKKIKSRVYCIMTYEKAIVYIEYGLKTFKTSKLLEMSNVYFYVYEVTNNMIRDENDNLVFVLEDILKISFDCNTEEIKYEIEEEKLNENLIWFKNMNININGKYLV